MNNAKLFFNINKSLSVFTKIRCHASISEGTRKKLYVWPLPFERDSDLVSRLRENGITTNKYISAEAREISYEKYKALAESTPVDTATFRVLRDISEVGRLIEMSEGSLKVSVLWDAERSEPENLPKNTSDEQAFISLRERSDIQFSVESDGASPHMKLPGYLGEIVFINLGLLPGRELNTGTRSSVAGKKADSTSRSPRIVIASSHLQQFKKVAEETEWNINSALPSADWIESVRALSSEFHISRIERDT